MGSELSPLQLIDTLLSILTRSKDPLGDGMKFSVDELDNLDAKLVAALSTTRTIRNTLSTIYRLPPETMARIFDKLQQEPSDKISPDCLYSGQLSPRNYHYQERSMNLVTSVCRYWRDTAFAYPNLWSFVFSTTDAEYARTSLGRSGEALLKIHFGSSSPASSSAQLENDGFMEDLVLHSHRFQELRIDRPHFEHDPSVLRFFRFPAPRLEALDISLRIPPWTTPALPTLFDGQTPNLHRLTLQSFTSWPGNTFTNLTHIHLHGQSPDGRPSLSAFLEFLEASPQLEELALVHAGITHDETAPVAELAHPLVALPNLRIASFGCWESVRAVRHLLFHLAVPATASIQIWGQNTMLERTQDLSALCLAHSGARAGNLDRINELRMIASTITTYGSHDRTFDQLEFIRNDDRIVQFHARKLASQMISLMAHEPQGAFGGVETVWLGSQFGTTLTVEHWRTLFESLPALQKLVIWRAAADPILSALTVLSGRDDDSGATCICPKLHTLHIHGDKSLPILSLSLFAKQRKRSGRPLSSLRVVSESVSLAFEEGLEGLKGDVVGAVECEEESDPDWTQFVTSWPPLGYESRDLYF